MRGWADMRRHAFAAVAVSLAIFLATASPAQAGQACADKPLTPTEVVMSMDLAQRTVQALDASGAKVALVSRAGQQQAENEYRQAFHGIRLSNGAAGPCPLRSE